MTTAERLLLLREPPGFKCRLSPILPELAAFLDAAVALRDESTWQTRPAFDAALAALTAKLTPR